MYPRFHQPPTERHVHMSMDRVRQLAQEGTALYIKNNTRSIVTINDDTSRMELGPKGSENSVLPLPNSKLNLSGLQRMIRKGSVEVGPFEDFEDDWNKSEEVADQPANLTDFQVTVEADKAGKDLVEKTCLITGKSVFQTMEDVKNERPPLHESVAELENQFVVRHVQNPEAEGGYDVTWDRVQIG